MCSDIEVSKERNNKHTKKIILPYFTDAQKIKCDSRFELKNYRIIKRIYSQGRMRRKFFEFQDFTKNLSILSNYIFDQSTTINFFSILYLRPNLFMLLMVAYIIAHFDHEINAINS